ncbi:MAG: amidohydrolase [Clostridia bacterium]|nr:amidohydrolase [Clostridia bacterium]
MDSYVVRMRREFHMHPEIGFDLPCTLKTLRAELDRMGVEYTEEFGKSSIVATVNPEKDHFTIGVRADMDALPIQEENDVPYRSLHEGKMHACGHDAHTAIALATLREIHEMRDKINCRVKFLFQPAEEFEPSGAMLMARDGVMKDIDCIVGLHVDTNFDVGHLAITPGPQNATSDGFMLDFYGTASHAARQHLGVDANVMAMRAFMDIELTVAKEISAKKPVIFNMGAIHGGTTNNIICDHCSMFCTLRTWEDSVAEHILDKIHRIIEAVASTAGGRATFTLKKHYPIVHNDETMTALLRAAGVTVVGEENMHVNARGLGGEDFSYLSNEKPGAFLRLGVRNKEKGLTVGAHNGRFDLDEDALELGVKVFKQFILDNQNGIQF